jgi:large repetitive protein
MSRKVHAPLARAVITAVLALGLGVGVVSPVSATPSSAPTGLSSTGTTIPTLSWNRMVGAVEYQVQGSETDSFSSLAFESNTNNTSYVPTRTLKSGSLYWRVRATDGQGWGPYSLAAMYTVPTAAAPTSLTVSAGQATSPPVKPPVARWAPVIAAVSYTLQVDDEGDEVNPTEYANIRGTSYVIPRPQAMGDYYVRVRANFDYGLQTQFTPWVKYDVDRLPDVTAVTCAAGLVCAPSPSTGVRASVTVQDVVLDWDPVQGASKYEVWIAKDISFSTPIDGPREVYGTRYSPAETYDNAPYFWKVRAVNAAGEKMPWPSTPNQFQRRWNMAPTLVYPPNDLSQPVGDDIYYQWTPVKHASSYRLDVGSDANFTPGTYQTCYTAQTTYTPGHAYDRCMPRQGVPVYWRVKSLDRPTTTEGLFSDTDPIEPDNQAGRFVYDSGRVNLISPADGAPLDNTNNLPALRWSPSTDAAQYDVEILNNAGNQVAFATTSALSYTPSDKLVPSQGPFRWTVVAVDADGKRSPKYQGRTFSLTDETPVFSGSPLDPVSGGPEPVNTRVPRLRWNPMPGAAYYRLRVSEAGYTFPINATPVLSRHLSYPSVTDDSTFFVKPGTYTWWVEAYSSNDSYLGSGGTASFTVSRPQPVTGQRLALDGLALDSATACASALADNGAFCDRVPSTPVLDWEPVAGVGGYLVYLAWDRDVSNRVYEPYASTTNSRWTPTRDILNALKDNESQESYFWFIRPCVSVSPILNCGPDPANQPDAATHAFRKVSPAVKPQLPLADSVERGSEVTFSWEDYRDTNAGAFFAGGAASSHQSARSYRLQVSQNATITDANAIQDVTVDQATFTSWTRTYPEGDIWWRVQAIDDQGNRLAWSPTRKFVKATPTLNLDPNTAVINERALDTNAFPAFNSHQPAGTTTLAWSAYDFDGTWQIQIAKNDDTTGAPGNMLVDIQTAYQAAYTTQDTIPASGEPYRWRVRRIDVDNKQAAWSDWGRFYVDPALPILDSPAAGAVQPPNGPVFQWQPLEGARNYRVRVLTSAGDEIQGETTAATAWAVPRNLVSGNYRWQVTAYDMSGRAIGTSERPFVVEAGLVPTTPTSIQAPGGTGVGATLTSTPPVWNQSDVTTTYQWMRDGGTIYNANQPTYTLTLDDFGKDISLKVTGKRPSYADGASVSSTIRVTAGGALQATSQPRILGTPAPGSMLSVENSTWSQPYATLSYQWFRTGAPIPKATNGSYWLTPDDAGKEVSVVIFAKKAGFADGSLTAPSVSVTKLTSTTQSSLSTTRIKKGKTVKVGVTVTVAGVPTPTGTVKIQDGVKTVNSFTMDPFRKGIMTVKLSTKKLKAGRHKIKLVYMGNSSTSSSKAKVIRLVVFN